MTLKRMVSGVVSGEAPGRPKVNDHDAKAYGVLSVISVTNEQLL